MKKACKVILIVISTVAAVVGICTLVCGYMMRSLKGFEFDDDILFDEEKEVYPKIVES
jgi:hypothetical protein